ncbi:MAG: hypothetical protein RL215_195, partial [Planctomycetota bacterium]
ENCQDDAQQQGTPERGQILHEGIALRNAC